MQTSCTKVRERERAYRQTKMGRRVAASFCINIPVNCSNHVLFFFVFKKFPSPRVTYKFISPQNTQFNCLLLFRLLRFLHRVCAPCLWYISRAVLLIFQLLIDIMKVTMIHNPICLFLKSMRKNTKVSFQLSRNRDKSSYPRLKYI